MLLLLSGTNVVNLVGKPFTVGCDSQEAKSARILKSFAQLVPQVKKPDSAHASLLSDLAGELLSLLPPFQETIVLRGGKKLPLPVNQVVLGDIVDVKFGDRAPADIRIIRSAGLKVRLWLLNLCTLVSYNN